MRNSTDADNSTDVPISTDVHAPRWAADDGGEVLVRFDSGFPCLLRHHSRAATLIALLGQPHSIQDFVGRVLISWKFDNEARQIEATLALSRDYSGNRKIVSVSASPAAFLAAARIATAQSRACGAEVRAVEGALVAARVRLSRVLDAEKRALRRHSAAIMAQFAVKSDK